MELEGLLYSGFNGDFVAYHGVHDDKDDGIPEDGGLGKLEGDDREGERDGLSKSKYGCKGEDSVCTPAEDKNTG